MKTQTTINQGMATESNLTELIEENRQLLQEKKKSYQQKISKYAQKLRALQKCFKSIDHQIQQNYNAFDDDDEELQQNKLIIQTKMQQLHLKINEYQQRLQKLHHIQSQMHQYLQNQDSHRPLINCLDQSTSLIQKRHQSSSSSKSHHKKTHKQKAVNGSGKKMGHMRERTASNEDPKPNIFNTPISKSFQKNAQIDDYLIDLYSQGLNHCPKGEKWQRTTQRVPLGQLIMGQQSQISNRIHASKSHRKVAKDERQIAKFFNLVQKAQSSERQISQNNRVLMGMGCQTKESQHQRSRTKSVPTIYPFGKGEKSSSKKSTHTNNDIKIINQNTAEISVTREYITQLKNLIGQLFSKYPFICESPNQYSTFNPSHLSTNNLSESLYILLSFIESQDEKFEKIKEERQKNEKTLCRVNGERKVMKSLEYDKMSLEQEIEDFQTRVQELIDQERKLLESIDRIEGVKHGLIDELKTQVTRLRLSLQQKFPQPTVSKLQLASCPKYFISDIDVTSDDKSLFQEIFLEVRRIKKELNGHLQGQNGLFLEVAASKAKLQSNLEKLKAEHEMMRIKREQVSSELAQTTTHHQDILRNVSMLQQTIQHLNTKLDQQQSQQQSLSTSITQLSSIIDTKKQSIKTLDETIEKKKQKKKELFDMVDKVEKILEEADREQLVLCEKIEELKEEAERLGKENEELGKMNDEVRTKLSDGRIDLKKLEQEHRDLLEKLKEGQENLSRLKSAVQGKKSELSSFEVKLISLMSQQTQLSRQLQVKFTTNTDLQGQISVQKSELSLMEDHLLQSQCKLNQLEDQLTAKEQQITCVAGRISVAEINLRSIQRQEQVLLDNIKCHQSAIQQLETRQTQIDDKIQQTLATKEQLQGLVIQILQQKELYLQELQTKNQQLLHLQQQLHSKTHQFKLLQSKNKQSQLHQNQLQTAIEQLSQTLEVLEVQTRERQEEQAEIVYRIKLLKRLEVKKCLHQGLVMSEHLSPEEEKIVMARIDQVAAQLEEYESSKENPQTVTKQQP